jgi:type I restriction enzyme M protein
MQTCDLHTILRLPTGIFYKQGVQANVLFFQKRTAREQYWTQAIWIYDFRTGVNFTLKQNPLKETDLAAFIECYNASDRSKVDALWDEQTNPDGRWRKYTYDEIIARDKTNLDIRWLKTEDEDDSTIGELMSELQDEVSNINDAMAELQELLKGLDVGDTA